APTNLHKSLCLPRSQRSRPSAFGLWPTAGSRRCRAAAINQRVTTAMLTFDDKGEPSGWGTWEDAEALRRWSFRRRTPDQRLAWLISALELAYAAGALSPRMPDAES